MFDKIFMAIPFGTHEGKSISIGSDAEGAEYKNAIKNELGEKYGMCDYGVSFPPLDDPIMVARQIVEDINSHPYSHVGIYISKTGDEIFEVSRSLPNVYAGRCLVPTAITRLRTRENTNILAVGIEYFDDLETTVKMVKTWLETPFSIEDRDNLKFFLKIAGMK